jgi:hypothetical protein
MFVDENQQTTKGDFFMESIQQIAEKFIREVMAVDICTGLTGCLERLKASSSQFICQVVEQKLVEMDEVNFANPRYRQNWTVEHKNVPRELLTTFGMVRFSRRYYRNHKSGERRYLVDELAGIVRSERVEAGLAAELCEAATDNSYAKSARICCDGEVSRQTVLRKTRQVKNLPTEEVKQREGVRVIHIQADEDHVAMQDGRRDTIVKLVAIHEPAQAVSKKRWQLPQRRLMSSYNESVEDFWLRVAEEIDRRYSDPDNLTIYIHGDGASWIRSGTKWLSNSHFVLDKFHVSQMATRVTGNIPDYKHYIWDQFDLDDRQKINEMTQACIDSEVCAESTGMEFMAYVRNNWDGIRIWYDERHQAGRSCAEGLVSHVLSSRLSSRPCGWRDEGLETISRLRVHVLNGGKITSDNVRKSPKPAIRATKALQKAITMDTRHEYHGARILHTDHRSSPEYRLFKAITNGGFAI